jgi:hypothetical protein
MKAAALILLALAVFAARAMTQTPHELGQLWDRDRVSRKFPSNVRHADLKNYLQQLKQQGVRIEEVGRSAENREIYQMEYGRGPLRIFMWSQMHGDEPTATSALVDMFSALYKHREKAWAAKIAEKITIRAVPMLNPDGAEYYTRRNSQGIDINRDALNLVTPEARLLKQLRDSWSPAIGFNLHNQQELTSAGRLPKQAAISLLVVYGDEEKTTSPGHERNTRISSAIVSALNNFIPGNIGRYSDEWTPTAFGDNFSAWGTPTILIETGGLYGKDEMFLVKLNFVALLTALNSLATGSEANESPLSYELLPNNSSGTLAHFVFRRVGRPAPADSVAAPPVDVVAVIDRRRQEFVAPVRIRSVAATSPVFGFEEFDASGFYVVPRVGTMTPGDFAELLFYKKDRVVDYASAELEKSFPPDAVFSTGKWIKGKGVVPRIR